MRIARAAVFLILAGVMPAAADEIPARKAGLWEIRTVTLEIRTRRENSNARPPASFQQCTDAATDRKLMLATGFLSICPRNDVLRSSDGFAIDSACTIGDETHKTHTAITGSFDSAYTMTGTYTFAGSAVPTGWAEMTEMKEAKWLGPCTAGQKPGDIVWSDGRRRNVLEEKPVPAQDRMQ
jgi:hypothetical protein